MKVSSLEKNVRAISYVFLVIGLVSPIECWKESAPLLPSHPNHSRQAPLETPICRSWVPTQHNPAIEAGNLPRPFSEHIICARVCARRAGVGQQHHVSVLYTDLTKFVQQHKSQGCTVLALVWYNNTRPKLNHTWLRSSTVYGCFTFV